MSVASKGFAWSSIERFSSQGIGFLISIILARIIAPSAYGLIVMIQVFINFSQLFIDGGFANALIQKQDRNNVDYNTVFIFNMALAIFLYFVLFFTAPYIADFYREPKLIAITRVIAINLIFSSLSIVQRTRLTLNLDFKTQTKASITSVIISGILGIACAYKGMEVWALVVQTLTSQFITSLLLMYYSKWRPSLIFSYKSFKQLFSFGSKLMFSNILTSIYINITNLIIGRKYSVADLAFYNRGYTLSLFPSVNISDVMNQVIYPILAKLQDDRNKLKEEYLKYLHLCNYVVMPLMALLIVLAKPLVLVLLKERWIDAVPFLQLFSLNFIFYPIILQSGLPVAAVGNSKILFNSQVLKRIVTFVILIISLTISIKAVCYGIIIGTIFEAWVNLLVCKKVVEIGVLYTIKKQLDIIISITIASIATYFITTVLSHELLKLIIGGFLGITIYIILTYLFRMNERIYLTKIANNILKNSK